MATLPTEGVDLRALPPPFYELYRAQTKTVELLRYISDQKYFFNPQVRSQALKRTY